MLTPTLVNLWKEISNLKTNEELFDYFEWIRSALEWCDNIDFWWELWKKKKDWKVENIKLLLELSIK